MVYFLIEILCVCVCNFDYILCSLLHFLYH